MEINAVDIINLICGKLGIVATWTEEEAWPYIQSLLQEVAIGEYQISKVGTIIGFCLTFVGLALIILGVVGKQKKSYYESKDLENVFLTVGIIMVLICGIMGICFLFDAIKWKTMPTIKSYEWLFNLISRS